MMLDIIQSHYKRFSKFTIVGVVNTAIDFSIFYALYDIYDVNFLIAHISAFFIALINSFFFNALWTFKNLKRSQLAKQVLSFFIIGLIGLTLSTSSIYLASIYTNIYIAKILAMVVSLVWNYSGSWFFVFKE